jgi:hypothetical protein
MLLVIPFLAGGVLSRRPGRTFPFLTILICVLLLPYQGAGTFLIYQRFFVFVIPLLIFALEYHPEKSTVLRNVLPVIFASVVLAQNFWDVRAFDTEQEDFHKVIEHASPDSRIQKLVFLATSTAGDYGRLPVYDHFPSWHHLRGQGLVDFNFAAFGKMPVSYNDPSYSKRPRFASGYDWKGNHGECYDYFISRAYVDPFVSPNSGLRIYKNKVELVASAGYWFLHKNKHPISCLGK